MKDCTESTCCATCNSNDHSFRQCENRIATIRQERDELASKQWNILANWSKNKHPKLRISPEKDNSASIPWIRVSRSRRSHSGSRKSRRAVPETKRAIPTSRTRTNGISYANVTNPALSRVAPHPSVEEESSVMTVADQIMKAIQSGKYENQEGLNILKRLKQTHQKQFDQEQALLDTMIEQATAIAQGLEFLKHGKKLNEEENKSKKNPRKRNYVKKSRHDTDERKDIPSTSDQEKSTIEADDDITEIKTEELKYGYIPNDNTFRQLHLPVMTEIIPLKLEEFFNKRLIQVLADNELNPARMWKTLLDFEANNPIDNLLPSTDLRFEPDVVRMLAEEYHMDSVDAWNYMKWNINLLGNPEIHEWSEYLNLILQAPRSPGWARSEQ